jgi:hypothetical protein
MTSLTTSPTTSLTASPTAAAGTAHDRDHRALTARSPHDHRRITAAGRSGSTADDDRVAWSVDASSRMRC